MVSKAEYNKAMAVCSEYQAQLWREYVKGLPVELGGAVEQIQAAIDKHGALIFRASMTVETALLLAWILHSGIQDTYAPQLVKLRDNFSAVVAGAVSGIDPALAAVALNGFPTPRSAFSETPAKCKKSKSKKSSK